MRTIVVWKRVEDFMRGIVAKSLRENHSGMETDSLSRSHREEPCCVRTIVVWKLHSPSYSSRDADRCVRTIVVWKLTSLTSTGIFAPSLRKNHSGMNCCLRQDAVPGRSSREVMRRIILADAMPGEPSGDAWLASPGGRTLL